MNYFIFENTKKMCFKTSIQWSSIVVFNLALWMLGLGATITTSVTTSNLRNSYTEHLCERTNISIRYNQQCVRGDNRLFNCHIINVEGNVKNNIIQEIFFTLSDICDTSNNDCVKKYISLLPVFQCYESENKWYVQDSAPTLSSSTIALLVMYSLGIVGIISYVFVLHYIKERDELDRINEYVAGRNEFVIE